MSVQNEVQDLSPWIKYSTGMVSLFERIGESIQAGARDVDDIAMAMFGDVINNWVASADASVETMEQRLGSELFHSMNVIVDLTSNEARISPYSLPNEHEVNLYKLWLMEDGEIQVFWHGEGRIYLSTTESFVRAQTNLFLSSQLGGLYLGHASSLCDLIFDGLIPASALNGAPWLEEIKDPLRNSVGQYGVYSMLGSRVGATIRDKFLDHTLPITNHIGELVSMIADNYRAGRLSIPERTVCIKAITEISAILELLADTP